MRQAFHKIRLARQEDGKLTTFRNIKSIYKYEVLPFGLINGPATFQRFMNDLMRENFD